MYKTLTRIILLVLIFLVIISSGGCTTPGTDDSIKNTDDLIVILHAGGGYGDLTHLNAQETFEYYYNMGYRYFEYDLRLTSDGRIIATHAWEHIDAPDI